MTAMTCEYSVIDAILSLNDIIILLTEEIDPVESPLLNAIIVHDRRANLGGKFIFYFDEFKMVYLGYGMKITTKYYYNFPFARFPTPKMAKIPKQSDLDRLLHAAPSS
jgi:hypothetical protein